MTATRTELQLPDSRQGAAFGKHQRLPVRPARVESGFPPLGSRINLTPPSRSMLQRCIDFAHARVTGPLTRTAPPMARPTIYTPELAALILNRISDGQSMREVCRDEAMPARETVRPWLRDNDEFRGLHAQARQEQMDALGEEILEIIDDASNDWMDRNDGHGGTTRVPDPEVVARSRLRIQGRQWLMSKLAPRKYGDKLAIGGDEGAPPIKLDDVGLARKLAFLMTRGLHEAENG